MNLLFACHTKPNLICEPRKFLKCVFLFFHRTFSKVAIPNYLPHAFFIEGGALAVENALKVAFDWKVRKNIMAGKGELGKKIIHFIYFTSLISEV